MTKGLYATCRERGRGFSCSRENELCVSGNDSFFFSFFGDTVRFHWAPYICQISTSLSLINLTHQLSRVIYIWWFLATPALTFRYGERSSLESLGKKNQLPFFQVIRANLGAAYNKIGKFDQILAL